MVQTIVILSLQLSRLLLCTYFQWLPCVLSPFISWISGMSSFMVILQNMYIWSNTQFICFGGVCLMSKLPCSLYGLNSTLVLSLFGELSGLRVWHDPEQLNHSISYHHTSLRQCMYLVLYADHIIITCSDLYHTSKLNHLFNKFQMKDLRKFKGFLGIEIVQSNFKYILDIFEEIGVLDYKPIDTHGSEYQTCTTRRASTRSSENR